MKFIFDENISPSVPKALDILQKRLNKRNHTNHQVFASIDLFGSGTKDPEIFKKLTSDSILLTFDVNQQRKWQERIAIQKQDISIFYFRFNSNLRYWKMVLLFVNAWEEILEKSVTNKKPFLIRYRPSDVRKFTRSE